jgi:hypothetical protein
MSEQAKNELPGAQVPLCERCSLNPARICEGCLQAQSIDAINKQSQLLDEERRRWYTALAWIDDFEGLAPEVVGARVQVAFANRRSDQ